MSLNGVLKIYKDNLLQATSITGLGQQIIDIAKSTPGVKSVNSRLEVYKQE